MASKRIRFKVRLIGIEPKCRPARAVGGWFALEAATPLAITAVLKQFGLDPEGLLVLKGGAHVAAADPVADGDTIQIFLKSLGG